MVEEQEPQQQVVPPQPVPVTVNVQAVDLPQGPSVVLQLASVNGVGVYFLSRDAALEVASAIKKAAQTGSKLTVAKSPLIVPGQ